jgi:hypothetical protein
MSFTADRDPTTHTAVRGVLTGLAVSHPGPQDSGVAGDRGSARPVPPSGRSLPDTGSRQISLLESRHIPAAASLPGHGVPVTIEL